MLKFINAHAKEGTLLHNLPTDAKFVRFHFLFMLLSIIMTSVHGGQMS